MGVEMVLRCKKVFVSREEVSIVFPGKLKEGSMQATIRELSEETDLQVYEMKYLFRFHASRIFRSRPEGNRCQTAS
ncbi:hypothetical protein FTO70_06190 [Methanosarcina sp. KYL-1]|uniref:hypothetical protein n=1 Tax=Methanosarcina sp. KYL-1 TaxID=2602068 RepID=UPI0021015983|nr:hypothetical protein [Methanosarcina sp. KYL-1]MCQ1535286.1 hypothetical protein [Methanosarcina sp. KYL-1]